MGFICTVTTNQQAWKNKTLASLCSSLELPFKKSFPSHVITNSLCGAASRALPPGRQGQLACCKELSSQTSALESLFCELKLAQSRTLNLKTFQGLMDYFCSFLPMYLTIKVEVKITEVANVHDEIALTH